MPADEILDMLKEPGMTEWTATAQGTMKFAAHLCKVGTLKTIPKAWTDYYRPITWTADLPATDMAALSDITRAKLSTSRRKC